LIGVKEYESKKNELFYNSKQELLLSNNKTEKKVEQRVRRYANQFEYPYVLDRKIYLELMVVVDEKMEEYYGDNLENHVLTLMFLAAQMYQHTTLINPIRVYITDIIYLSKLDKKVKLFLLSL
jgi:hypothetical protein